MQNFFSTPTDILLAEDEESLHQTLRLNLEMDGYNVHAAFNGQQAIDKLEHAHFDLLILDIMMPGIDGLTVLERMRLQKIDVPVLILSARSTSADRIAGLRLGADDYLTKPFELEELLLRVSNLVEKGKILRNPVPAAALGDTYSFGGHTIDFKAQTALLAGGDTVPLSKKEAMLLQLLISYPYEVVTREKILQTVWGYQVFPNTRTIDNFILSFRKHFEADSRQPRYFHSVRGVGYKFTPVPATE